MVKLVTMNLRVHGHRFDIAHRRTDLSPVSSHFNSGPHTLADMSVMVMECSHSQDPCLCRIRESRWIRKLGTSYPLWMNLRKDSLWNLPPFNTPGILCAPSPSWLGRSISRILIRPRHFVFMWRTSMLDYTQTCCSLIKALSLVEMSQSRVFLMLSAYGMTCENNTEFSLF